MYFEFKGCTHCALFDFQRADDVLEECQCKGNPFVTTPLSDVSAPLRFPALRLRLSDAPTFRLSDFPLSRALLHHVSTLRHPTPRPYDAPTLHPDLTPRPYEPLMLRHSDFPALYAASAEPSRTFGGLETPISHYDLCTLMGSLGLYSLLASYSLYVIR